MLSRQLLLRQQLTRLTCVIKNSRHSSQLAVDPDLTGAAELRLSAHKPKLPAREPFAKNLFVGKFDIEFLTYPEPQTHDRHREFFEWLRTVEDYINERVDHREIDRTRKIPNEVFDELKRLGVLRAALDESYGGLGLNSSEFAKLVETVSAVPVLGTYLVKRDLAIKLIKKFGTEQQKANFLPKIATGEIVPAVCFSESPSGTTSEPLESIAAMNDDLNSYTINGHKTYVADAKNANLFVVLAQHGSTDAFVKRGHLSAFLVPSNAEGIVISEPVTMLGQQGLDLCDVTFNDVKIPKENRFSPDENEPELFVTALGEGKHYLGGQAIGVLKRFLNVLTESVIKSKNFNVKRESQDAIHDRIARVASTLYAMEAITYLTTGMIDGFENQDSILEQAMVESYCTESCIQMILLGTQLVGSAAYRRDENFELIMRDALSLRSFDRSGVDTKVFAALLGVQHAGQNVGELVKKERNPLFHPLETLMSTFSDNNGSKLYLEDNLHPSLKISAESLERSVHSLRKCVLNILIQYGISVMGHKMELKRLADVIIEIYTMIGVVARASRSYCIGTKNAEQEVRVAMVFTYQTYEKVNLLVKELNEGDWANGDRMYKDIADCTFQNKSYFAAHPLDRTY